MIFKWPLLFLFSFVIECHPEVLSVQSPKDRKKFDTTIGKYLELAENEALHLKCYGNFVHPYITVSKNAHSSRIQQREFQDRVEEHHSDRSHYRDLYIRSAKQSDTGIYSCVHFSNTSYIDSIYVFVSSSSAFLNVNETSSAVVTYSYEDGRLVVPCKTTKFVNAIDVELYANNTIIQMSNISQNYDPRYGFNISDETLKSQPVHGVSLSCRYKIDTSQKMDFFFTNETATAYNDSEFELNWDNSVDWPHIGLAYNLTCQLNYIGDYIFDPMFHQLDIICQNCADKYKMIKNIGERRRLSITLMIPSLTLSDSHKYICTWAQRGKGKQLIHHNLLVANTEFQVKFIQKSAEKQNRDKNERFSIRATFEAYPSNRGSFTKTWVRTTKKIRHVIKKEDKQYVFISKRQEDGSFTESLHFRDTSRIDDVKGEYTLVIKHFNLNGTYSTKWNVLFNEKIVDFSIIYMTAAAFTALTTILIALAYCRKTIKYAKKKSNDREASLSELKTIKNGIVSGTSLLDYITKPKDAFTSNVKRLAIDEKYLFSFKDITIQEKKLGKGHFGIVIKGLLQSNRPVAIKMNKHPKNKLEILLLEEELRMMYSMKPHKNVLGLCGAVLDEICSNGIMYVLTEFAENGDLQKYLRNNELNYKKNENSIEAKNDDLYESDLVMFAMQIANGMRHLTNAKCVHRDLACRNILITLDRTVKIADFGLSRKYNREYYYQQNQEVPLPSKWLSVEVMDMFDMNRTIKFTEKTDIWAFGICLFEIFSLGQTPYPGIDDYDLSKHVKSGKRNPKPNECPTKIYDFMNMCWKEKPQDRPKFSTCFDFFTKLLEEDYCFEQATTNGSRSKRKVFTRINSKKSNSREPEVVLLEEEPLLEKHEV